MRQSDSERPDASLIGGALRGITRAVARRPKSTLIILLLVSCAAVALTLCRLDFKTDRADLIDPKAEFHQRWRNYTESFGDGADLVVVVESDSPSLVKQVIDDVGTRLTREPEHFANVIYRFEPGRLRAKGLHFLNPSKLEEGLLRLNEYRPILQGRWDLIGLESLFVRFQYQYDARSANPHSDDLRPLLEHAEVLSTSLAHAAANPGEFRNPWPEIVPIDRRMRMDATRSVYFLNDAGTMGFVKALPVRKPGDFAGTSQPIARLREIVAEVRTTYPAAKVGITGVPVLESDEMAESQKDMALATVLSTIGVGLILFIGFRGIRHPMLALMMLAAGMTWAFGYTTLAVGHLNILSVSFAVILIGLGIDFAIHYLSKYLELRHEGKPLRAALLAASSTTGAGIMTAGLTTALAFFCATFTPFLGVAELGIIAGGGILLCALATFIVLPPLVALADQNVEPKSLPTPFQAAWMRNFTARRPSWVLAGAMLVVLGLASQMFAYRDGKIAFRVKYDYNLLNLQAEGVESVELQKRIRANSHDSLLFAVAIADSADHARQLRQKFEALPTVSHVEELASRLPANAPHQTNLMVQGYRVLLSQLPSRVPQPPAANPSAVGQAMENFFIRIRNSKDPAAMNAARAIDAFLNRFEQLPADEQARFLSEYQYRMAASLLGQFHALSAAANPRPVQVADLPPELTSRFISPQGKWLVQVYPRDQIWDLEPLARFVKDVRSVDPNVTGTPLQNYEASRQIMKSYETAAVYAFGVIFLVLMVDFMRREHLLLSLVPPLIVLAFTVMALMSRRTEVSPLVIILAYLGMSAAIAAVLDIRNLRDTLLALLPSIVGGLMMFGFLGLCGVHLNPANLIVLPLILGIGVDDGVHVMHDFRRQQGGYRTSASTFNSMTLTTLTTMVGFGSMMLASHQGLFSVGLVLTVGVASCLFVSLVMLPPILTLLAGAPSSAAGEDRGTTHKLDQRHQGQKAQQQQRRAA